MSKSNKRCESWADKSEWLDEEDFVESFLINQAKNKDKKDRQNRRKQKQYGDELYETSNQNKK